MTATADINWDPTKGRKLGMAIGIIAQRQVPTKWMFHMMGISKCLPSGMFWSHVYTLDKYYDVARQEVVEQAQKLGAKWLLFVDTDVFLPPDAINRLMSHNKDIVTGVYWMKTQPPQPIIYKELGNGPWWDIEPSEELTEIEGAGLGCCLIKMEVFDKMQKPYFKVNWSYMRDGVPVKVAIGEDHYFFTKAREAGFKIWCDTQVMCDHYDVVNDVVYPGEAVVKKMSQAALRKAGKLHLLDAERKVHERNAAPRVVFYNASGVQFNGYSIKEKPIAGSETAVIHMAKEFAKKNCNVTVYCNCDKEATYDDVLYKNYDKLGMQKECEVFISSRNADIFLSPAAPAAKQNILWAHDMPDCPGWNNIGTAIDRIDKIFFVSEFQKDAVMKAYPVIPSNKAFVSRNGVDKSRFAQRPEKIKNRLIYSTTPFRGLDVLLDVFPRIKEQVPDVTLDVYSGMKIYNCDNGNMQTIIDKAKSMQNQGVFYHDSVKQSELAVELQKAYLMAYPNTFPETSCITAMESITAGTPIVTTHMGALPETIGSCGTLVRGNAKTKEYQDWFVSAVVDILKDENKWKDLNARCLGTDFGWDTAASKLYDTINVSQYRENFIATLPGQNVNIPHAWPVKDWTKATPEECNTTEYWDLIYKTESEKHCERMCPERLAKLLGRVKSTDKVLDFGCGRGELLIELQKNGVKQLYGVDISTVAISEAMKRVPGLQAAVIPKDIGINLPYPEHSFDVVILSHVLEHFKDDVAAVEWLKKYLAPGGHMIIVLPINDNPWREHFRIYKEDDVSALMKRLGGFYQVDQYKEEHRHYDDGRNFEEVMLDAKW